jgi:hypothetical protein
MKRSIALLLACVFAVAAPVLIWPAAAEPALACVPRMPCLTAYPAAGPIGTVVHLTGRITRAENWWRREVKATPFIELGRQFSPAGGRTRECGFEGGSTDSRISVAPDGAVTGSFVVATTGHCFQTERHHATSPEWYYVVAGCLNCVVGVFQVTAGTASTGSPVAMQLTLAVSLILLGSYLTSRFRRIG